MPQDDGLVSLQGWNPFKDGCPWDSTGHKPYGFACLPDTMCANCHLRSQHDTSRLYYASLTEEMRENMISVRDIRIAQFLLWRAGLIGAGLLGWQQGFIINGETSINFADFYTFDLLPYEPEEGDDEEEAKRRVWLINSGGHGADEYPIYSVWAYNELTGQRRMVAILGSVMPGDVLEITGNSVASFNNRPVITKIVKTVAANNGLMDVCVELDQDISWAWDTPAYPWDPSGSLAAKVWREAGARPKFHSATMIPSDYRQDVCAHCHWDPTGSVGNFGVTGTGIEEGTGHHYYCALRKYKVYELDEEGELHEEICSPSKILEFAPRCALKDCDLYAPVWDAGFRPKRDFGAAILNLIWPQDKGIYTPPGCDSSPQPHLCRKCVRLGNPSITSLSDILASTYGDFALQDLGPADQVEAGKWESSSLAVASYDVGTDENGNTMITTVVGPWTNNNVDFSEYGLGDLGWLADDPFLGLSAPIGFLAETVQSYWERTIPSTHLETRFIPRACHGYTATNDLYAFPDRRGLSRTPNYRPTKYWIRVSTEECENDHLKVKVLDPAHSPDGYSYAVEIEVKPLVERDQEPALICTRTVRSVEGVETTPWCKVVLVDLEPTAHSVPILVSGDRTIITVHHGPGVGAEVADYAQPIWWTDKENITFGHTGRAVRFGDVAIHRVAGNQEHELLVWGMIPLGGHICVEYIREDLVLSRTGLTAQDLARCDRVGLVIPLSWDAPEWLENWIELEFWARKSSIMAGDVKVKFYDAFSEREFHGDGELVYGGPRKVTALVPPDKFRMPFCLSVESRLGVEEIRSVNDV